MYSSKNEENKLQTSSSPSSSPSPSPSPSPSKSKSLISAISSSPHPLHGIILTIPSTRTAQLATLSPSSAQWALIDTEHSPISALLATEIVHTIAASSRGACLPLIRIPSHAIEWIKWALDSGAAGIVVPMVNNAAEMARIIDAAAYPPVGRRSFGPVLAPFADPDGPGAEGAGGGVLGYYERARRRGEVAVLPMIESREGLENVREIVAMEGVAGVFVGPYDLRLGLGLEGGQDGEEDEFVEAMQRIVAAAKSCGKVVGTVALGEQVVRKRTVEGFDFLGSAMDYAVFADGCARTLEEAKKASSKL